MERSIAYKWVLTIAMIGIATAFLWGSEKTFFSTVKKEHEIYWKEGWKIEVNQKDISYNDLDDVNLVGLDKGSCVVIQNVLPEIRENGTVLAFRNMYMSVEVYLDQELRYSYGQNLVEEEKMIPKTLMCVPVEKEDSGKEVCMVFHVTEDYSIVEMGRIYLGNLGEFYRWNTRKHRLTIFVGTFLVFFGVMLFILAPILLQAEKKDFSILFCALISFMMGLYILCYYDIFLYFAEKAYFFHMLEYALLYATPPVLLAFILDSQITKGSVRKIEIGMMVVDVTLWLYVMFVSLLNIHHINEYLIAFHIIAVGEGVFAIISLEHFFKIEKQLEKEKREEIPYGKYKTFSVMHMGIWLFVICAVTDIVRLEIEEKIMRREDSYTSIGISTIGALIFVICLMLNYFFHQIEYINSERMKKKLEGLAYVDALTQISNRTHCELTMAELEKRRLDYVIVSFDLDGLKKANDQYGHSVGDKMISGFAAILKENFQDADLLGRMGGDEFLVLYKKQKREFVEQKMQEMLELVKKKNQEMQEEFFFYQVSWGIAAHKKWEKKTVYDVYMQADQAMYEMKRMHHERGGERA